MLHIGVAVLSIYFCLTSLWWLARTTTRYYHSQRSHVDFKASVTFPCCSGCRSTPVDGILKMAFAGVATFVEFSLDKGYEGEEVFLSRMELGTVLAVLLLCGAMDVLAHWGAKTYYKYVDYAGLCILFAATAAVLETRACATEAPLVALYSLSANVAIAGVIVTVAESVNSDTVLCPVIRSFCFLLQGTWWLNISVLLQPSYAASAETSTKASTTGAETATASVVQFFTLLFAVHVAVNFLIVLCLWLLVGKLVEKNWCGCARLEGAPAPSEGVFLENRVHLDYHMLSRFGSDSERE